MNLGPAGEAQFARLLRSIDLSDGFTLHPVEVPAAAVAQVLAERLRTAGHQVVVHRMDGWQAKQRIPALTGGWIVNPPVNPPIVMLVAEGAEPAPDRAGWQWVFRGMNAERNALVAAYQADFLLCGPAWLHDLAWDAADLWSLRSLTHRFALPPAFEGLPLEARTWAHFFAPDPLSIAQPQATHPALRDQLKAAAEKLKVLGALRESLVAHGRALRFSVEDSPVSQTLKSLDAHAATATREGLPDLLTRCQAQALWTAPWMDRSVQVDPFDVEGQIIVEALRLQDTARTPEALGALRERGLGHISNNTMDYFYFAETFAHPKGTEFDRLLPTSGTQSWTRTQCQIYRIGCSENPKIRIQMFTSLESKDLPRDLWHDLSAGLTSAWTDQGRWLDAQSRLERLHRDYSESGELRSQAYNHLLLARVEALRERYSTAHSQAKQAHAIFRNLEMVAGVADALLTAGRYATHLNRQNNAHSKTVYNNTAYGNITQSRSLAKTHNWPAHVDQCDLALSHLAFTKNQAEHALALVNPLVDQFKGLAASNGLISALSLQGSILLSLSRPEEARLAFERVLSLSEAQGWPRNIAIALLHLARSFRDRDHDKANRYYRQALGSSATLDVPDMFVEISLEYAQALTAPQEIAQTFMNAWAHQPKRQPSHVRITLAKAYAKHLQAQGDNATARNVLIEAAQLATQVGRRLEARQIRKQLAKLR